MGTQSKTNFKDNDTHLIVLEQNSGQHIGHMSSMDSYSGTGTATLGAPRCFWGTGVTSGDDSCHLINRVIEGTNLFSHAVRDESSFYSLTDGGYCSFDASPTILKAPGHAASFQSRIIYNSPGNTGEIAGFVFGSVIANGNVDQVFGFRIRDVQIISPGSADLMAGIWIDPLSGATANYGIFVANNDSYLGGNLQINGTLNGVNNLIASGKVRATGGLGVGNSVAASTLGAVIKKMQVFDAAGSPIGYVPVYDAIT